VKLISAQFVKPFVKSNKNALPEVLENVNQNLTPRMRNLVAMLWSEWKDLELQIIQMNDEAGTDRFER
jgi:5-methylcytosine-specific restriction endonuclease McrBC regulatory subunit McrC